MKKEELKSRAISRLNNISERKSNEVANEVIKKLF